MAIEFDPNEIIRSIENATAEIMIEDSLLAFQNVVLASPVGDPSQWKSNAPAGYVGGHFRRNWHVTKGTKSDEEFEGVDRSGGETVRKGHIIINTYELDDGIIAIQNALPYARRLQFGWSDQAPKGWIEEAVNIATQPKSPKEI